MNLTSRRAATAGILGSAVAALALFLMGGNAPPRFGDPLPGLTDDELDRFQVGKAVFYHAFDVPGGLGPVFNDTACTNCHNQGGDGGGSDTLETRYGRVTDGVFDPLLQFDGQLLHTKGIGLFNGVDFVGEVVPTVANVVARRRTTPLFGLGLVDAVPDQTLEELAAFQQLFTPATAGRTLVVTDVFSGQPRVGRFGWKCQIGTVLTFSGNAFLNEMGITTPFFPHENCPGGDCALLAVNPARTNPNDATETVMQLNDHTTFLAPPPQKPQTRKTRDGGDLFAAIGCADCHVPALQTGPSTVRALDRIVFFPFSDFLLHDMGNLGDGIVQSGAHGNEMRTAPLWGARVRSSYLHDGRAKSVRDAILAHDGQGLTARNSFASLDEHAQDQILDFIDTL
jgi:CxxC motif-containing protein (DUF1111 family)